MTKMTKETTRIKLAAKYLYASRAFRNLAMQQALAQAADETVELLIEGELRAQLDSGLLSHYEYATAVSAIVARIEVEIVKLHATEEAERNGIAIDEVTGQPVSDYPRIVA